MATENFGLMKYSKGITSRPLTITVVIPAYNTERFIIQALESVWAQTRAPDEFIVIDDGSVDNTMQLIQKWRSQNTNLNFRIFEQANQGICSTLNKLIKLANGKYIRIVSSDDMVLQGSTPKLVNVLLSSRNYKLAAFGDAITVNAKGDRISKSHIAFLGKNPSLYKKDVLQAIITQWAIAGPSILLRKTPLWPG